MPLVLFLFLGLASSDVPCLRQGSSLSVENPDDVLVSANGMFSAGFYPVGQNVYCFAIWFSKPCLDGSRTVVWTAKRDTPVNGRRSKLSMLETNKIILTDSGEDPTIIWMSKNTVKAKDSWSQLKLLDSGNLVLQTRTNLTLWQSFDSPTDTLLPGQPLTRHKQLVSARSRTDYSSGKYKLLFDDDNVLRLVLDDPDTSSIYWPDSTMLDYLQGRSRYNDSKIAVLDSSGYFLSSDNTEFRSADFGFGPLRRLTLDFDGNLRLYSLEEQQVVWFVTWQAMSNSCRIHEACGPNSICSYKPGSGPKCGCPPGCKMKNQRDWNNGCKRSSNFHAPTTMSTLSNSVMLISLATITISSGITPSRSASRIVWIHVVKLFNIDITRKMVDIAVIQNGNCAMVIVTIATVEPFT
ncbi:NFU domain protein 4 isoform 1 [Hibiscus syriacus]|uniref:NFU domain protein 4 isoform 1 n=1 Tax=Hibiscus syriacus TaxID=106335 RepID=A0A6A2YC90_HIBSY|nr:NFU domain protein 4 isoform 1 [Hibiscus syriacus]